MTRSGESVEIAVVLGSVTPPGRLRRVIEEAVDGGGGDAWRARLFDLAEERLPFADGRSPDELGGDAQTLIEAISAADAVVLATPVYRGSMTGALKNLLDNLPVAALEGKVVGLISMGASDHHYLGAERHLRDVVAFFGPVAVPVAVYLTTADFEAGSPKAAARRAVGDLLEDVALNSSALRRRPARPQRPLATAAAAPSS